MSKKKPPVETRFRVLIFKGDRTKVLGGFAYPMKSSEKEGKFEWYSSSTPVLMTNDATMEGLKHLYPGLDMSGVKIVDVELTIINP